MSIGRAPCACDAEQASLGSIENSAAPFIAVLSTRYAILRYLCDAKIIIDDSQFRRCVSLGLRRADIHLMLGEIEYLPPYAPRPQEVDAHHGAAEAAGEERMPEWRPSDSGARQRDGMSDDRDAAMPS